MHCEHKYKRVFESILKCKLCGKVIVKDHKKLVKTKEPVRT